MPDLRPTKGKRKWVFKAKFNHGCPDCTKDMIEYSLFKEIDIEPDFDGTFFAPIEWETTKCPHDGITKGHNLLKSAYVK